MPLTCHPSPSLTSFAFRSSEVRRLLLDLDPYGGTDPSGMFPLFLNSGGPLTFNQQFLVISIVIDTDRGHCYEHLKKIKMKIELVTFI